MSFFQGVSFCKCVFFVVILKDFFYGFFFFYGVFFLVGGCLIGGLFFHGRFFFEIGGSFLRVGSVFLNQFFFFSSIGAFF